MKKNNYYKILPPLLIAIIIGYYVFKHNAIELIFSSIKTVMMAFVIIYLFEPIVNFIQRKSKFGRGISILLTFLLALASITLMFVLIIPNLVESIVTFSNTIPDYLEDLTKLAEELLTDTFDLINLGELFVKLQEFILNYASSIINNASRIIGSIAIKAGNLFGILFDFLLAIFMAYYALTDTKSMVKYTKRLTYAIFDTKIADYLVKVTRITDKAVKDFLIGKIITCIILGFLVYIGIVIVNLFGLNIPFGPLFGLIIGITNLIPYIGPLFGTIPCILIALFNGIPEAIALLAIILIMQQIDNIYVSPKILGDTLGVKPFWVVASVAIGGTLFGAVGMVLSVPVVAVIQTLLNEVIESKEEAKVKLLKGGDSDNNNKPGSKKIVTTKVTKSTKEDK